jgi:serine/threonine-protein kinase RsbW
MGVKQEAISTASASALRWEKTYLGLASTAQEVRSDVRAALGPCPDGIADDAVLVASELAANAIRHSRSGKVGGTYTVGVLHCFETEKIPYVWIRVEDQGSPSWDGIMRPEPLHGLSVIEILSAWMGSRERPDGRRTVYARLDYRADGTRLQELGPVPQLPPDLI